jgi:hypothetical protein
VSAAYSTHGRKDNAYKVLEGTPEETDHLEDQGVDGKMILKCNRKK